MFGLFEKTQNKQKEAGHGPFKTTVREIRTQIYRLKGYSFWPSSLSDPITPKFVPGHDPKPLTVLIDFCAICMPFFE